MQANLAFQNAILAARKAGIDHAEIARVTGLTEQMVAAVLRNAVDRHRGQRESVRPGSGPARYL